MHERPSQYLIDKCKSLDTTISFFGHGAVLEKRLTFLAQIEFWDWEMDEMIYAIESFQKRSQAWEAGKEAIDTM